MNDDFERKLAAQPFREPPPELRELVLGRKIIVPEVWTWRDWLWPSPRAWAALAAVWALFAAVSWSERPSSPKGKPVAARSALQARAPLFAFRFDLFHVLDSPNN